MSSTHSPRSARTDVNALTKNDATMKALRSHCLQIELETSPTERPDSKPEDSHEYNWFYIEAPTHAERHPSRVIAQGPLSEELNQEIWARNGRKDTAAAEYIAKRTARHNKSAEDKIAMDEIDICETYRENHLPHQMKERKKQQEERQNPDAPLIDLESQDSQGTIENLESPKTIASMEVTMAERAARKERWECVARVHAEYKRACVKSLRELEYGPMCVCHKYPWQYVVAGVKGADMWVHWEKNAKDYDRADWEGRSCGL